MSLDIWLTAKVPTVVFDSNITHNLTEMADKAGIYKYLWRPEELNITKAEDLIFLLKNAITDMQDKPEYYKQFDSPNGWGTYEQFLPWLEELLEACIKNPKAIIGVSR